MIFATSVLGVHVRWIWVWKSRLWYLNFQWSNRATVATFRQWLLSLGHVPIFFSYWCLVGNGWEWGNGMIITSDYGSFPHSLLGTSKFFEG